MKTIIIGLGNPILTDDGVGVKVAHALQTQLEQKKRHDLDVAEASVGGLRLMEMMVGYDRVILIDALCRGEGRPGTIHRLSLVDLRDVSPTQHSSCVHDMSLVTALDLGATLGLDLPQELDIFAVEVENVSDFGEEPTPAVAAAVGRLTTAIMMEFGE